MRCTHRLTCLQAELPTLTASSETARFSVPLLSRSTIRTASSAARRENTQSLEVRAFHVRDGKTKGTL